MRRIRHNKGRGTRVALGIALGAALVGASACDSLLEVELPHLLTDAALEASSTAEVQVNSAIALFECGYTGFGWVALGHEDVLEALAGLGQTTAVYRTTPAGGTCDTGDVNQSWIDQFMAARAMISRADGRGVYDRINGEWSLGAAGQRLSAISALYMAASLKHFGEFYCEMAFDGGSLVTPTQALNMADTWIGTALGHAPTDFAMPFGIANSHRNMAIALRAQIRWAKGTNADLVLAAADAATVLAADPQFTAWVTRGAGFTRRNRIYATAQITGWGTMGGPIAHWNPAIRRPNPVTGVPWADPIIFTGYLDLGMLPNGRIVSDAGYPITTGLANPTATRDNRVRYVIGTGQAAGVHIKPIRYAGETSPIPMVSWKELLLIQAENANEQGNRGAAIGFINTLRARINTANGNSELVPVTYIDGTATYAQVRYLLQEEQRRTYFAEGGRYYSVKIQNPDLGWFPRSEGNTLQYSYNYQGAVRMTFATDEYRLNDNFLTIDQRGTGCDPAQAPVIG